MADDNWDLHAVVRGCTAATASSSSITQLLSTVDQDTDFSAVWFENLSSHESSDQELQNIHSPFFPQEQNKSVHSPWSALWGSQDHRRHRHRHLSPPEQNVIVKRLSPRQTEPYTQKHHLFSSVVHGSKACGASRLTSWRPKRRKKGLKKVCHVAADNLCCDVWCWRKYGQKSIKGSPYPRGYYRCSTSKGCTARKQVERHRSDPGMFIVTYTAEHNHPIPSQRSSLARVSRGMQKPAAEISNSDADPKKPSCSPAPESRREGSAEGEEDDDDLFAGLEGFAGGEEEGSLSVYFRADL